MRHVRSNAATADPIAVFKANLAGPGLIERLQAGLIGNGALINGVSRWFKAHSPATRVVGVVAAAAPSMRLSWLAGRRVTTERADSIADGIAVRDQGAYEFGSAVPCGGAAANCPAVDTTPPKVSKLKYKKPSGKKGASVSLTLSEAAKVQLTFKPVGKPKRTTLRLSKQSKAGASRIKIRKGKLKAGKYKLSVSATDAAGNKSESVVRKVKVGS